MSRTSIQIAQQIKSQNFSVQLFGAPPDIVAVLVRLTTRDGSLPQGSPASPILAYLSYRDMWNEISSIARKAGNQLTVYVDDVTISGPTVLGETLWEIKKSLRKHGHATKDSKEESIMGTPVIVTGVVLRDTRMLLPNYQHQKRHELQRVLEALPDGPDREKVIAAIAGHNESERQILKKSYV